MGFSDSGSYGSEVMFCSIRRFPTTTVVRAVKSVRWPSIDGGRGVAGGQENNDDRPAGPDGT